VQAERKKGKREYRENSKGEKGPAELEEGSSDQPPDERP